MEGVTTPFIALNHSETLVVDEVEFNAEELDEVVAPQISRNHDRTIVSDEFEQSEE
jgi:hypothetical protein